MGEPLTPEAEGDTVKTTAEMESPTAEIAALRERTQQAIAHQAELAQKLRDLRPLVERLNHYAVAANDLRIGVVASEIADIVGIGRTALTEAAKP